MSRTALRDLCPRPGIAYLSSQSRLGPPEGSGAGVGERPADCDLDGVALALALIAAGTLALADGVVTLAWQEPISAIYAKLRQDDLRRSLAREERTPATARERHVLGTLPSAGQRIAFLASELERKTPAGDAVGRIVIPRIGASFVIVKGTSTSALESGPGIYP